MIVACSLDFLGSAGHSWAMDIRCWQCGQMATGVILPLSRREECAHCRAELHVCRQCEHYQAQRADQCAEERAERVSDKTLANFCDYFKLNAVVATPERSTASEVSPELAALFGLPPDQSAPNQSESTPSEPVSDNPLDSLFGLDKPQD